jgi:hypothetical protein
VKVVWVASGVDGKLPVMREELQVSWDARGCLSASNDADLFIVGVGERKVSPEAREREA